MGATPKKKRASRKSLLLATPGAPASLSTISEPPFSYLSFAHELAHEFSAAEQVAALRQLLGFSDRSGAPGQCEHKPLP